VAIAIDAKDMSDSLKVRVIENKGPNTLTNQFKEAFKSHKEVDFAVAFLNSNGLRLIDNDIRGFLEKQNTKMRILTRISNEAFNEPSALKWLLDMSKEYPNLEIKLSVLRDKFHAKMYIFKQQNSSTIFIGSSNLTEKALGMEGEINVRLCFSTDNDIYKHLAETFEESWEQQSTELKDEIITAYTSYYDHLHSKKSDNQGKRLWQKISVKLRKNEKSEKENTLQKVWLDYSDGELSDATEMALKQYCSWKKYECYSCGLKTYKKVKRNDILIMADFNDNWLSFNIIKSKTQLPHAFRNDGKYFLAYAKKKGTRRKRINKNSLTLFSTIGIISRPTKSKLKPTSAREICEEALIEKLKGVF
jgi:HKD family nuclease